MSCKWGYGSKNGPQTWNKSFPVGDGLRQSPIDFVIAESSASCPDLEAKPLDISYEPQGQHVLQNTGAGWKVDYKGESKLTGGPLGSDVYRLEQFHCHWGGEDCRGSEHTINGKRFAAELHLVHYNTKYGSFGAAVDKSDGLAVIGVFLSVGDENQELGKVTKALKDIKFKGSSVDIAGCDPDLFLPDITKYFTYEGSLTTPPLYESVTWVVFAESSSISKNQLDEFRHLCRREQQREKVPDEDSDDDEGCIKDNYRPPVNLGERQVRSCNVVQRKCRK